MKVSNDLQKKINSLDSSVGLSISSLNLMIYNLGIPCQYEDIIDGYSDSGKLSQKDIDFVKLKIYDFIECFNRLDQLHYVTFGKLFILSLITEDGEICINSSIHLPIDTYKFSYESLISASLSYLDSEGSIKDKNIRYKILELLNFIARDEK